VKELNLAYVDDEQAYVWLLEHEIEAFNEAQNQYKINFSGFDDSTNFLDEYNKDPDKFDLVMIDMILKEKRGFDLLKPIWVKEKPVIMCSGHIGLDEDLPSMMPKAGMKVSEIIYRYLQLIKDFHANVIQLMLRATDSRYALQG